MCSSDLQVRLYAAPYTGGSAATTSDAEGHFEFNRRTAGEYKLWFRDVKGTTWVSTYDGDASTLDESDGVTLTDAADLTVDATLQPRPAAPGGATKGAVEGQVTDAQGQPISGIQVRLIPWGGTGSAATTTDGSGHFAFTGRAPGFYQVWFRDLSGQWVSEYFSDAPTPATANPVAVTAGQTADLYASLAPKASAG